MFFCYTDNVKAEDYSGSLVNVITPYAFIKQILEEGHKGIICTAGNSSTGIALLGFCSAYKIPLISITRNADDKKELEDLETDISGLEEKKLRLEDELASGVTDYNEIQRISDALKELSEELEEKTMRWLELQD